MFGAARRAELPYKGNKPGYISLTAKAAASTTRSREWIAKEYFRFPRPRSHLFWSMLCYEVPEDLSEALYFILELEDIVMLSPLCPVDMILTSFLRPSFARFIRKHVEADHAPSVSKPRQAKKGRYMRS